MAGRSRVCCTDTDMLVADDLSRTSAIGGNARGVAGAVHADALQQWRQCFDLAIAENATAITNSTEPTIHNRKRPCRQFIAQPAHATLMAMLPPQQSNLSRHR